MKGTLVQEIKEISMSVEGQRSAGCRCSALVRRVRLRNRPACISVDTHGAAQLNASIQHHPNRTSDVASKAVGRENREPVYYILVASSILNEYERISLASRKPTPSSGTSWSLARSASRSFVS